MGPTSVGRMVFPLAAWALKLSTSGLALAGDRGVLADLRNQVVVVGVEPLGHFQRGAGLVAAGQHERGGGVDGAVGGGQVGEAGGQGGKRDGGVQDLVVVGEVAGQRGVGGAQAQAGQLGKVGLLQFAGRGVQGGLVGAVGPVGLEGLLEFAVRADARVAEDGCCGEGLLRHGVSPWVLKVW